jgi:hypothetical protein
VLSLSQAVKECRERRNCGVRACSQSTTQLLVRPSTCPSRPLIAGQVDEAGVVGVGAHPTFLLDAEAPSDPVRVQDGKTITFDGTVAGIDATPGSCYVVEADDKDAVIAFAARIPATRIGGAVEVRPVGMYWPSPESRGGE